MKAKILLFLKKKKQKDFHQWVTWPNYYDSVWALGALSFLQKRSAL
jgi:hypothetical protein